MRSAIKLASILAAITALFNSCKNDLHILAPYKESVSVYGILNPQDTIQMIRINKIFLGEGNAYTMAQVSDSVNYKPGVLTVSLQRFDANGVQQPTTKGSTKTEIILRDTVIQLASTSSQVFNPNQRLYITSDRLFNSGTYKLKIYNNETKNVFTSQTVMVDTVRMTGGYDPIRWPFYPVPYGSGNPTFWYLDYSNPVTSRTVRFVSIANAREYTCIIHFHYKDSILGNSVLQPHTVDIVLPSVKSSGLGGGELLAVGFTSGDIYAAVEGAINKAGDPTNLAGRHVTHLDFQVTAGAQEYSDFLQISAPSTSVAQDKPTYTNIDGGFGIFSSKSIRVFPKALSNTFIDYMASKKPLCSMKFLTSSGGISFTCN